MQIKLSNNKIYEIGEGWINLAKKQLGIADTEVESLAANRLALCLTCKFYNSFTMTCGGGCGCVIAAKTRSIESKCPLNVW